MSVIFESTEHGESNIQLRLLVHGWSLTLIHTIRFIYYNEAMPEQLTVLEIQ